ANWILSILSPRDVRHQGNSDHLPSRVSVDCNATSARTATQVAETFAGTGFKSIDACIIGLLPKDEYNPTFHVSTELRDGRSPSRG
ncbi:hypothetical protein SCLCIDRAFT_138541, partial [Scleroderma citrinum Foug A]